MSTAAAAIMGLIAVIVGLVLLLILPGMQLASLGLLALGVILLAMAFILEFRTVRGAITSKRGKFSTSTIILVSVFVSIILLVNAISVWKNHQFDFTGLSQFTLTSQTKQVLQKLDSTVDVLCFFAPGDITGAQNYAMILLAEYTQYTTKLNITFIDPEQSPETARKYNIVTSDLYQSVVFQTDKGWRRVWAGEILSGAEHAFTSAILEVTGTQQKKIYFLTGHGEIDPYSTDISGYSNVSSFLQDNLLKVGTLDLVATPTIPDDLAVLVIGSPKKPMTDMEKLIIAAYLASNGNVLFLVDPDSSSDVSQLLAPWGLAVLPGVIIEPKAYSAPNKSTPLVDRTRNAWGYNNLYFPGASAIAPTGNAPKEIQLSSVVVATADSWIESDLSQMPNPVFDQGKDLKGTQWPIAVIGQPAQSNDTSGNPNATPEYYRAPLITVVGDSDFANNQNIQNQENAKMFAAIVTGMSSAKDLITIDRKVLMTRRLILSPEKQNFLNWSSCLLFPALVLIVGIVVWWRRR